MTLLLKAKKHYKRTNLGEKNSVEKSIASRKDYFINSKQINKQDKMAKLSACVLLLLVAFTAAHAWRNRDFAPKNFFDGRY